MEAAEKRIQNQENRGIKNPARVMQMQKKAAERDKLQDQAATRYDGEGGGLRVSIFVHEHKLLRVKFFDNDPPRFICMLQWQMN